MRLEEIEKRLAELKGLIDAESDAEKLRAYGDEVRSLIEERGIILGTQIGENRAAARAAFDHRPETRIESKGETMKLSKREAVNLLAGLAARHKKPSDEQQRAAISALTTTATEYTPASEDGTTAGVNNAGVFIPTSIVLDLLREEGKLSPILADIAFTNIKGLTVYPYRKTRTKAMKKSEGSGTGKNQFEMDTLELKKGWLQINIDVTDEVLALSDIDLGAYIIDNMLSDLNEDWAYELIYGNGTSTVLGIVSSVATPGSYEAGGELDAIIAVIKSLKNKYRRGAKVYVAQDVYDAVAFTKDQVGQFLHAVINTAQGISSIGGIQIAVDENLDAGDIVAGNVSKFYKANLLRGMSLESDKDINTHITSYNASQFLAAAPHPEAFVYSKLKKSA